MQRICTLIPLVEVLAEVVNGKCETLQEGKIIIYM